MNLLDIQIAVSNDNTDEVKSLLLEIDRRTEREVFQKAADHFGFKIIEKESRFIAYHADLARVFGYADPSNLKRLLERYQILPVPLGRYDHKGRTELRQFFNLKDTDSRATFINWDGFLLAGAKGQNEAARKVFAYLLQMERAGRIALGAVDINKTRSQKINDACKVVSMLSKLDRIQTAQYQRLAAEHLDDVLDGALAIGKQASLAFDKDS